MLYSSFLSSLTASAEEADQTKDVPEDVLGAYNAALQLEWSSAARVMVHFGDAPPHVKEYQNKDFKEKDSYPKGDPYGLSLSKSVPQFIDRKILVGIVRLNDALDTMIQQFQKLYDSKSTVGALQIIQLSKCKTSFFFGVANSVVCADAADGLKIVPPLSSLIIAAVTATKKEIATMAARKSQKVASET
jgi:hypothetical protein